MIALFESGTSTLHFSWWDGAEIKEVINIPYPDSFEKLRNIVAKLIGKNEPERIAASSVSSKWREPLFRAINNIYPGKLVVARTALDLGVKVCYDNPEDYGIDRALAAYAAFQTFHDSCVVVDAGTVVTVDAVASDGTIAGGYIFPGSDLLVEALSMKTGLPKVSFGPFGEGIGKSTITCIEYGISKGFYSAVNSLIINAMKIAKCENRVVVTGGGAESVKKQMTFPICYKPYLVLLALGLVNETLPKYT